MSQWNNHQTPSPQHRQIISSSAGRTAEAMARSTGLPPRLQEESWVEISSQPSSSSLSSISDDVVTTGLRVQPNSRRRRRVHRGPTSMPSLESRQTTSSQEEYDESESDDDQVMTSSNEHYMLPASTLSPATVAAAYEAGSGSDSDDDDDENATALGHRGGPQPAFIPQPNAFSHPPSSHRPSSGAPGSYFPPHVRDHHPRPSYSGMNSRQTSYNNNNNNNNNNHINHINPAADHDAALRASLTTLLSIGAAAARGLPKRGQPERSGMSNEPMGLRLVPESELLAPRPPPPANTSRPLSPSTRARSSPSVSSQEAQDAVARDSKRKASAIKSSASGNKSKKKRIQVVDGEVYPMISPTLLTWVMSAGVVVLVSVVGFGAGYVIGREVGRQDGLSALNGTSFGAGDAGGSCGKEMVRTSTGGLRKFRWGGIGGAARGVVA